MADPALSLDAATRAFTDAAAESLCRDAAAVEARARSLTTGPMGRHPRVLDAAVAEVFRRRLEGLWERGWLPIDVVEIARRQVSVAAASLAVAAVADACARYPAAAMPTRWSSQLRELDATPWWDPSRPYPGQWAERRGVDRVAMMTAAIRLTAAFMYLPALHRIMPVPGEARGASPVADTAGNEKVLARVRALLAKAESTSFPDEAEALSAKAQELMSRYSLEQAVASPGLRIAHAVARRIWLDPPYVGAKTLLVAEVGSANHCRTVSSEKIGFVTVLGDDLALDAVEVLATSLLVQATRAMLAASSSPSVGRRSGTRSFRHAFLLSYATRIGERLRDTAEHAEAVAGADLVPVFAERERAVERLFGELFPTVARRSFSARDAAGWGAGRDAADRAVLRAQRRAVGR